MIIDQCGYCGVSAGGRITHPGYKLCCCPECDNWIGDRGRATYVARKLHVNRRLQERYKRAEKAASKGNAAAAEESASLRRRIRFSGAQPSKRWRREEDMRALYADRQWCAFVSYVERADTSPWPEHRIPKKNETATDRLKRIATRERQLRLEAAAEERAEVARRRAWLRNRAPEVVPERPRGELRSDSRQRELKDRREEWDKFIDTAGDVDLW